MSTTVEKLFVQIFERKRWIVEQVKRQIDLYDQHLASKCLIDGVDPPPWLWSPYFPSQSFVEASKEEIISGLLLPRSRPSIICSSSHRFSYQQPVVTAHNVKTLDVLSAADHSLEKGLHEEDFYQPLSHNLDEVGCVPNSACEQDPSVATPGHCQEGRVPKSISTTGCEQDPSITSPGYCTDDIAPDSYPDPALSLARVQRSKSRQRALELRNSAKASKSRSNCKHDLGACPSENAGSPIASLRSDYFNEIKLSKLDQKNDEGCRAEEAKNGHLQCIDSDQDKFSTVARSTSPIQKASSVRESSSLHISASVVPQSGSFNGLLRAGCVTEMVSSEPVVTIDECCAAEEARVSNMQCGQDSETLYSGRITRSKSLAKKSSLKNEHSNYSKSSSVELQSRSSDASLRSGHRMELLQPITVNYEGFAEEEARFCNLKTQKGSESVHSGRVSISRTLAQESRFKREHSNSVKSSSIEMRSRTSNASLRSDDDMELKTGDIECKENGELVYSDGKSRSRSLGRAAVSTIEPLDVGDPIGQENSGLPRDSIGLSRGLVEPSDVCDDSCGVEKEKPGNSECKNENTHCCERKTRPRSSSKQHELAKEVKAPSVSCESNLVSDQVKVGAGDLPSSPIHDLAVFVKPKQLDFNENEECNLDETAQEKQDKSSKNELLVQLSKTNETDGSSCVDCQEKLMAQEEMVILDELDELIKEWKPARGSSTVHADLKTGASILPATNITSLVNETSNGHIDVVTNSLEKSNNVFMPNSLSGESTKLQVSGKLSPNNTPKERSVSCLSNVSADKERKLYFKEDIGQLDVLIKHANSASIGSSQDKILCGDHKTPMKADLSVVRPDSISNMYVHLTDPAKEHFSAALSNELEGDSMERRRKSCHSRHQAEKFSEQSCIPDVRNLACPRSSESKVPENSVQAFCSSSPTMDGSLMRYKRRKTEGQLSNGIPASPSLMDGVLASTSGKRKAGIVHSAEDHSLEHYDVELQKMIGSAFSSELQLEEGCLLEKLGAKDLASGIFKENHLSVCRGQIVPYHEDGPENTELMTCPEEISHLLDKREIFHDSVGSSHCQSIDLRSSDQNLPVLEGFIIQTDDEHPCGSTKQRSLNRWELPKTTVERASILEQMCRSASMNTPSLHILTTYNVHENPNLLQSVPNGLLEGILPMKDDNGKTLEDKSLFVNLGIENAFHGRSRSDFLPSSGAESSVDVRNPCASPVGKLWYRRMSKSASSEKRGSSSPDLPCISEENENIDEAAENFQEGSSLELKNSSVQRKPLADIIESIKPSPSVSAAKLHADRQTLASVNTEFSLTATHNSVTGILGKQYGGKRRFTGKGKENQSVLRRATGAKRNIEPLHNRSSKAKLSENTSLRTRGLCLSEKEPMRSNIVSNITSFIPLVQPKQAAAIITGKRDVKVKALEAAEAAKRLAEKKENERKMKKEALKLKHARQEQENLRKQELEKKRKEEERKKKEAEMAERKRQREEEEKRLKEAKRKRVGEAQRQQKEPGVKLIADKEEKESKMRDMGVKTQAQKETKDGPSNIEKIEQGRANDNPNKMPEVGSKNIRASKSNASEDSKAVSASRDNSKVTSNSGKATEEAISIPETIEESYDISPYKGSDDEDEEDDDAPNTKFVPGWASKNCVFLGVSSQQSIDPEKIFPPRSFCSISEVLMPRKHQMR